MSRMPRLGRMPRTKVPGITMFRRTSMQDLFARNNRMKKVQYLVDRAREIASNYDSTGDLIAKYAMVDLDRFGELFLQHPNTNARTLNRLYTYAKLNDKEYLLARHHNTSPALLRNIYEWVTRSSVLYTDTKNYYIVKELSSNSNTPANIINDMVDRFMYIYGRIVISNYEARLIEHGILLAQNVKISKEQLIRLVRLNNPKINEVAMHNPKLPKAEKFMLAMME